MSIPPRNQTVEDSEWRDAPVEVGNLRHAYEQRLDEAEPHSNERAIGRLWLRLWRAELRRDELLKRSE